MESLAEGFSMKYPDPDPKIPIVVFDLDGTLARSVWPNRGAIGAPIEQGIDLLRYYAKQGHRIEIYTARPRVDEDQIWWWVRYHGLPVDKVTCEKPFAGLYVDDRSFNPVGLVEELGTIEEEWSDDEITRMEDR